MHSWAAHALGESWKRKIVPVYIDNTAFCMSLKKGRSKAERLNVILRDLFRLSVKYDCVFEPHWIPTQENTAADALSRNNLDRFCMHVVAKYGNQLKLRRMH